MTLDPPGDRYPTGPGTAYAPPPPSQAAAGWALGLALVPCICTPLIGIGLAVAVLNRGRDDGRDHGRSLAIAAIIIGCAWLVLGVVGITVRAFVGGPGDEPRITGPIEDRSTAAIEVGDCFDVPSEGAGAPDTSLLTATVTVRPCGAPHRYEAFHLFVLEGEEYPGEEQVAGTADAGCIDAFRDFVGVAFRRSTLDVAYLYPSEETWRVNRDRVVTCVISDPDAPVTGTLAGTRR